MERRPPGSSPFPYTTLFRSVAAESTSSKRTGAAPAAHGPAVTGRGSSASRRERRSISARALVHLHRAPHPRSEEKTSELQSRQYLVCRLLLEKKNKYRIVWR